MRPTRPLGRGWQREVGPRERPVPCWVWGGQRTLAGMTGRGQPGWQVESGLSVPARVALQPLPVRTGATGGGGHSRGQVTPSAKPTVFGLPGSALPAAPDRAHWPPCPLPGPLQRPPCPTCESPRLGPSRRVGRARDDRTGLRADPRPLAPPDVAPTPKALEAQPTRRQLSSRAPPPHWPVPAGGTGRRASPGRARRRRAGSRPRPGR